LTPDPVPGGSANPYDYADQDPINNFDLLGEACHDVKGHRLCKEKAARRELHRALVKAKRTERRANYSARCGNYACTVRGVARYSEGGNGPDVSHLLAKVAQSAASYFADHAEDAARTSPVALGIYLEGKYGSNQQVQGCQKSGAEAWEESIDLWNSGGAQGKGAALADIVASCIGGALF
jgi:hypothetical protein